MYKQNEANGTASEPIARYCMWKNAKQYDIHTGEVLGYTNADRIRAMSDEELAQWLCCHITECSRCEGRHYAGHECEFRNGRSTGLGLWLKSPADKEGEG